MARVHGMSTLYHNILRYLRYLTCIATTMQIEYHGDGTVSLQSMELGFKRGENKYHVATKDDGSIKPPARSGTGKFARWRVSHLLEVLLAAGGCLQRSDARPVQCGCMQIK